MADVKKPNKRAKGDGTVYQRASDGMWLGSFEKDPINGKRMRGTVSAKTENEAKAKLRAARLKYEKNDRITEATVSVGTWVEYWYRNIAEKKNKVRTTRGYRSYIDQYIIPSVGKVRLDKLSPEHIRRMHSYIIDSKGLSSTTALQAHNILSTALEYAVRDQKLVKNPAKRTDRPQKADRDLTVLTAEHGIQVLRTSRDDRLGSRWATALFTGARQGEVLGLEIDRILPRGLDLSWQLQRITWEHGCENKCGKKRGIDCPYRRIFTPRHLDVRQLTDGLRLSRPKSTKGRRLIRVVPALRERLELRIEQSNSEPNPHGLVWTADPKKSKGGAHALLPLDGTPIDPSRDNKAWHALLERAGVPDVRLHDARHTTASLLQKANTPPAIISQILGHSAFITSMGYMDFDDEQMDQAMQGIASQLTP